eukprot:7927791-Alexandrium_andersonii.AAC.1
MPCSSQAPCPAVWVADSLRADLASHGRDLRSLRHESVALRLWPSGMAVAEKHMSHHVCAPSVWFCAH